MKSLRSFSQCPLPHLPLTLETSSGDPLSVFNIPCLSPVSVAVADDDISGVQAALQPPTAAELMIRASDPFRQV
jgi:hypothetical protein